MSKKSKAEAEKLFLKRTNQQLKDIASEVNNFITSDGTLVNFSSPSEPNSLAPLLVIAKTPPPEQELTPYLPYPNTPESPYTQGLTQHQLQARLREYCYEVRECIKLGRRNNIEVQLHKGRQMSDKQEFPLGDTVVKIRPMGVDKPSYYFIKAGDTLDTSIFLGDDLESGVMLIRDDKSNDYYLRLSEFHLLSLRNNPNSHGEVGLMTSFVWAVARASSSVVYAHTLAPIKMLLLSEWFQMGRQQAKDAAPEFSNKAIGGKYNEQKQTKA